MLLGTVTFQMTLWYLVHWPDKDIVLYTWRMLGDTVAIFAAVLLFTESQAVVALYLGNSVGVSLCCMFGCFCLLQLVTGICAGAFATRTEMVELQQQLLQERHNIEWNIRQIR